jgi:hypothetical protein
MQLGLDIQRLIQENVLIAERVYPNATSKGLEKKGMLCINRLKPMQRIIKTIVFE